MSRTKISRVRLNKRQIAELVIGSLLVVKLRKDFVICRFLRHVHKSKLELESLEGNRVIEAKEDDVFFPTTTDEDFENLNVGGSFRLCRGSKHNELDALVRIETIPSKYKGCPPVRLAIITCIIFQGKHLNHHIDERISVAAHEIHSI